MKYFITYNGRFIASRTTIKSALSFIEKKGLKDDRDNSLVIVDSEWNQYNPITGKEFETI